MTNCNGQTGDTSSPTGASSTLSKDDEKIILTNWVRLVVHPGQLTERRALDVKTNYGRPYTVSGYFDHDHLGDAVKQAIVLTTRAKGVYFIANSINPQLLARRMNRVDRAGDGELTTDKDIIRRVWLYIDIDPARDAKISASDEEKALAKELILEVRAFLRGRGWADPIFGDSGNGYHLDYRIDLPANDGGLICRVLLALSQRLGTDQVKIDLTVANPARLMKFYGTFARKGDDAPQLTRVHRRIELLEIPGCVNPFDVSTANVQTIPVEQLEALAAEAKVEKPASSSPPPGASTSASGAGYDSRLMVDKWLTARGQSFNIKPQADNLGRTVYVLAKCPFDASHVNPDACVMQDRAHPPIPSRAGLL